MSNKEGKKKLPIGIESFEEIRTAGFYYIDKTGLIRDLLQNWGKVNLFTRPRRFGKSLNMSMLKAFLEMGCDEALFDGLEISKEEALCEAYMGRFPVISISLKGANADDFDAAKGMLRQIINEEAYRLWKRLYPEQLGRYLSNSMERLMDSEMNDIDLMNSLRLLSNVLCQYYGKKVIILIDEYDVPLAKANEKGYYDQMVTLIKNMFEQALKTNDNLYFGVLTGCLRVAKESIFTGLNNLNVLSIIDVQYDEYFGFTDGEVKKLLDYYGLGDSYNIVKEWYDGYRFGNVDVYCPWDVICYCDKRRSNENLQPENYWANTSSNEVVRHFLEKAEGGMLKRDVEKLIAGECVVKRIHQELTYKDLYDSIENIWSVLFITGYLTRRGRADDDLFSLAIPNMEIRKIFTEQIMKLFRENVQKDGNSLNAFCEALKSGNVKAVETQFTKYLKKTISIRDTFAKKSIKENFYHGILLGILGFKEAWIVSSNKESGDGYYDTQIEIEDEEIGIVIEVKYAHDGNLDAGCQEAMKQIVETGYTQQMKEDGMQTILKYGVACYNKKCKVVMEREV
ncbi:MAG: AAA family ATPase [Lachnospiraceae bacterium]|nr:AAA family ATPase [Lachnospiraceae bacterium]